MGEAKLIYCPFISICSILRSIFKRLLSICSMLFINFIVLFYEMKRYVMNFLTRSAPFSTDNFADTIVQSRYWQVDDCFAVAKDAWSESAHSIVPHKHVAAKGA